MTRATLALFVTGTSDRSYRAIEALRTLCDGSDGVHLEIIDVLEDPERAEIEGIVATPTLVRLAPGPAERLVGDFSHVDDLERLLTAFLSLDTTEGSRS